MRKKPVLVRVGKHLVDPGDVAVISEVRRGLFVVLLKSQPNMEYPVWASEKEIGALVSRFDVEEK